MKRQNKINFELICNFKRISHRKLIILKENCFRRNVFLFDENNVERNNGTIVCTLTSSRIFKTILVKKMTRISCAVIHK